MQRLSPLRRFVVLAGLAAAASASQGLTGQEQAHLIEPGDALGFAVDVSGSTAVAGAPGFDNSRGAAYVFRSQGPSWELEATLTASNGANGDEFGISVAIEGDTIVVGAHQHQFMGKKDTGSVYVFARQGTTWTEEVQLSDDPAVLKGFDRFGRTVVLDGDRLAVGIPGADVQVLNEGAIAVFERDGSGTWNHVARLASTNPWANGWLGTSLALDGGIVLAGAPGQYPPVLQPGRAYVFAGSGSSWSQEAELQMDPGASGGAFGWRVALEGDTALVSSPYHSVYTYGEGAVYAYRREGTSWVQEQILSASDAANVHEFGSAVALFGGMAVIGDEYRSLPPATGAGAVYLFSRRGTAWTEESVHVSSTPQNYQHFGNAVALSGTTLFVGAYNETSGIDPGEVTGLARDAGGAHSYGVDDLGRLFSIRPSLLSEVVGPIGFANVQALAPSSVPGLLYAADVDSDQLLAVDATTGAGVAIGPTGFDQVRALAFDPGAGVLYGTDVVTDQLVVIDPGTGAGTAIGPLGYASVQALAFDPVTTTLYGADRASKQLLSVDVSTGAATPLGFTNVVEMRALGFDPAGARLLTTHATSPSLRYAELDTTTGKRTLLAYLHSNHGGAAYAFGTSLLETYCTAGVSASGCQATLAAAGTPSASASSGYLLTASNVEGAKNGFFYFAANGRQAAPWGNGSSFQCVVPPTQRGGLMSGVGTGGSCDGAFTQDLNALWCAGCPKPLKNPGPGAIVQAQLWHRDPFNTSNLTTNLSNAIEFLVDL